MAIDKNKNYSLLAAARDFFGQKEGQTALEFGKEYQKLSADDKSEISDGLKKLGYTINN